MVSILPEDVFGSSDSEYAVSTVDYKKYSLFGVSYTMAFLYSYSHAVLAKVNY